MTDLLLQVALVLDGLCLVSMVVYIHKHDKPLEGEY